MGITIFYAWQSDRDQDACRFLIRDAAKLAVKKLKAENHVAVKSAPPPELDEATKNVPGHPHIAATIRRKIAGCGVFLADLTHVCEYTSSDGRPKHSQNANVMIELGIAIRAKGFTRLMLVMNDAFGGPEHLPFDLKSHSFPIQYTLADASDLATVKAVREKLACAIADKLKPMLIAVHEEAAAALKAKEEAERTVLVTASMAMLGLPNELVSYIAIKAVNTGTRPVTITQARILLSDGQTYVPAQTPHFGPWKLPTKLNESDSITVLADPAPIHAAMMKAKQEGRVVELARIIVTDSADRHYMSEPLKNWNAGYVRASSSPL